MNLKAPIFAVAALCGLAAFGHDMWIEPASFFPQAGQIMGVRLKVGENLVGDAIPRDPRLVNQFVVQDAAGRKTVPGRTGSDPAGLMRVESPGVYVIGYYSNPSHVELPADKFNEYLKQEGLDAVTAARARNHQTDSGVRELFSRCAKSLVLLGSASATAPADRVLGFPLELVAERNPYAMRNGGSLPLRLTYENRPLAGAMVVAIHRMNPGKKLTARSDKAGRVQFRLPPDAAGMWMIKAVHMVPATAAQNADWSSYWASLTFEMPAAAAAVASK